MQVFIKVARQNGRVYLHLDTPGNFKDTGRGHVNLGIPVADAERLSGLIDAACVAEVMEARISVDDGGMGGKFEEYL